MNIIEARIQAEKKINSQEDALREAIDMLASISHGYSYGTWEYLAMVERMREYRKPSIADVAAFNEHP